MKKTFKWLGIVAGALVVLVVAAVILIPQFVDVEKYKPRIEQIVTEKTGRPFELGGEIDLSVFPWVGVRLTDLRLGNPQGFDEPDFVSVESFEVRLKLMPLLTRNIRVKTFVVEKPRLLLVKRKDGTANWENPGGGDKAAKPEKKEPKAAPSESAGKLPVKSLAVGNFAITDGLVRFTDKAADIDKEIKDINLTLRDLDLTSPVAISFSALADEIPVSLKGKAGPLGREPGSGEIPLDLTFKAAEQMQVNLAGSVTDTATRQQFDMNLSVAEFSLKKLFSSLDQPFPVQTSDPEALKKISLNTRIKGTPQSVSLSQGRLVLDDSEALFTASAKDFSKPDVGFDIRIDRIDLDRYLPAGQEKTGDKGEKQKRKQTDGKSTTAETKGKSEAIDFEPLRKLVLDGSVAVGRLKAFGANMTDIVLEVNGKNGVFLADPLKMNLYQGSAVSKAEMDVRRNTPATRVFLDASGIQAGPLMKDTTGKHMIEGTVMSDIELSMKGQDPQMIKKTLNGGGKLVFNDGAIVGVDIAGMVRNAKSGAGLSQKSDEKPRTDFSELRVPFDVTDGVVDTSGASLQSPLLRVSAAGKADLVNSALDFRVEPKVVGTLKGQGDTEKRSGIMVPLLVTGTFSAPKLKLDLQGMMKSEMPDKESIKKTLEDKDLRKKTTEDVKEQAEKALKGFLKQ